MNILAIDYGQKRIGLAWVQSGLDVVLPFGVVKTKNWKQEIGEIVKKEKIDKIVIGLPVSQDGGMENKNVQTVRQFIHDLQQEIRLPVEEVDERFSSQLADKLSGDLPAGQAGATRDEKAAMVILQTYLDRSV